MEILASIFAFLTKVAEYVAQRARFKQWRQEYEAKRKDRLSRVDPDSVVVREEPDDATEDASVPKDD